MQLTVAQRTPAVRCKLGRPGVIIIITGVLLVAGSPAPLLSSSLFSSSSYSIKPVPATTFVPPPDLPRIVFNYAPDDFVFISQFCFTSGKGAQEKHLKDRIRHHPSWDPPNDHLFWERHPPSPLTRSRRTKTTQQTIETPFHLQATS